MNTTSEEQVFQNIVKNTIALFDTEYANKAIHSNLTRQLLIDKWLTNKRIKVTTYNSYTSCYLKWANNAQTSLLFYDQTASNNSYKYIIHWAEHDALDLIIRKFKQSRLQKRMDRLISLMKDVIGKDEIRYNSEFKALIVEYASKKKHLELADYNEYVKRIERITGKNNLNNILSAGLTVVLAQMFV